MTATEAGTLPYGCRRGAAKEPGDGISASQSACSFLSCATISGCAAERSAVSEMSFGEIVEALRAVGGHSELPVAVANGAMLDEAPVERLVRRLVVVAAEVRNEVDAVELDAGGRLETGGREGRGHDVEADDRAVVLRAGREPLRPLHEEGNADAAFVERALLAAQRRVPC